MRFRRSIIANLLTSHVIFAALVCVFAFACRSEPQKIQARSVGMPSRVVSLAPNVTEILFALGAGSQVVAVTRFCDFPPEATQLPKIGGFVDPSFEAVLSHHPDFVIGVKNATSDAVTRRLNEAGISATVVSMESLADTRKGMLEIGKLVGKSTQADALVTKLDDGIRDVSSRARRAEKRRVVVVLGHRPLVVVGPNTFIDELIQLAGGINAAGQAAVSFPTWSAEAIAASSPDVIIDTSMGTEAATDDDVSRFWAQWGQIPAVRDGRVSRIADASLLRPGPRLTDGLRLLGTAIYPEAFADE